MEKLTSLEICAGAGGQALGLELAGFEHVAAVEIDSSACATLRLNRPTWNVVEHDLRTFDARPFKGVDLLAGGVPCPPFSIASKQLGGRDERDLFPEALRIVTECEPQAILLENVRGLSAPKFASYRCAIISKLTALGYRSDWKLVNASDFGVPQLRPRFILIALKDEIADLFQWPIGTRNNVTVGESLGDLMAANGWRGAEAWALKARKVAPTLVGGSKKHGGADLGPTRARRQWLELGVDGRGIVEAAPANDAPVNHLPRLTLRMAARIQGFPDAWHFSGKKTAAYRQVGNAFPPPVACALGQAIADALRGNAPLHRDDTLFSLV